MTTFVSDHANHASAKLHLDAELAKTNREAYTSLHLATVRAGDGFGAYIHLFEVINHTKADHVPNRICALRMVGGIWEVVGS